MSISCSKVMCSRARCGRKGPFGDHTGFYTPVEDYPVFHLTAITHRKDAVYPTHDRRHPADGRFLHGRRRACAIFLPVFKMNFPEIVDMALPAEGVFHNLVFVSIRKQYPCQAFKVMHGLWGMGQMMFSKYIVVVDEDCDVHNTSEVLFRLCANTDPQRDSTIIRNPSDSLDHAPSDAEHRLAHGLRRHPQTAGRELSSPLAGAAEDGMRGCRHWSILCEKLKTILGVSRPLNPRINDEARMISR